jgi:hypothetical protein
VSGGSDYWLYEEATTVSGPGYTRYLLNSLSTSSLPARRPTPGVLSREREFSESYTAVYRKFKESLDIVED